MSAPAEPIRVALIAPALSVRLGLRALLAGQPEIEIVGEAAMPADAGWLLSNAQVCLLAGRAAVLSSAGFGADGPAILLLSEERPSLLSAPAAAPAWGFLPLDCSPEELGAAVHALAAGLVVAPPGWLERGLPSTTGLDLDSQGPNLTPREAEVLQQLALGLANKQIANALGLSENTVKFHISAIYVKLGASNRAEAVRLGARQGWISL